jgi:hypothetical protein
MPNVRRSGAAIGVNARAVSSEVIEGEAIIMNHETGYYFNALDSGALIWGLVERGTTIDAIVAALTAQFQVDPQQARVDAEQFIDRLAEHDLIAECDHAAATNAPVSALDRAPYAGPVIEAHTDLADLLLLDPVHEVSERGWPSPDKL